MSRKKNTDIKSSIKEKISSTWGIIIAAFTIFGMGFGAGRYVANTYAKIQHNDDVMKLQKEKIVSLFQRYWLPNLANNYYICRNRKGRFQR